MFNRETHKSRGFGFIIFDNEDGVDRVCDQAEHSIHGKAVSFSMNLFVCNSFIDDYDDRLK